MKKLIILLPMGLLFILAACANGDGEDVSPAERQEFREQVESQIAEFNEEVEAAKERSEELSGDAKAEIDESIRELEEQRGDLQVQLEEMWEASDEEWEAAREDVEEAMDELGQGLNEMRESF